MDLFHLILGSSSYFSHGNMPIHHTQHVEYLGSFCRLPQGTLTDVSEYEQDTTLIIGRWAWIYSWMDLFYVLFGSSSYFDKGIVIIFRTLNHKHRGYCDRHLCAKLSAMYCKMHDIHRKIGRWVQIEHWLVLFHLIFWSSSYFNPGIMVFNSHIVAIVLKLIWMLDDAIFCKMNMLLADK